ncbi:hypothetical protein ACFL0X_02605, partial [Nanoarchaeota archaeon]
MKVFQILSLILLIGLIPLSDSFNDNYEINFEDAQLPPTYFENPIQLCGNNYVNDGEQCDDGNIFPGDGCDENCQIELCGNGYLNYDGINYFEECDEGRDRNSDMYGDRCRSDCTLPRCGDRIIDDILYGEECDNGEENGNWCSLNCEIDYSQISQEKLERLETIQEIIEEENLGWEAGLTDLSFLSDEEFESILLPVEDDEPGIIFPMELTKDEKSKSLSTEEDEDNVCIDTDARGRFESGVNFFVHGEVLTDDDVETDKCENNVLTEYYCNKEGEISSTTRSCNDMFGPGTTPGGECKWGKYCMFSYNEEGYYNGYCSANWIMSQIIHYPVAGEGNLMRILNIDNFCYDECWLNGYEDGGGGMYGVNCCEELYLIEGEGWRPRRCSSGACVPKPNDVTCGVSQPAWENGACIDSPLGLPERRLLNLLDEKR